MRFKRTFYGSIFVFFLILFLVGCSQNIKEVTFIQEKIHSVTIPQTIENKTFCKDCLLNCSGNYSTACVDAGCKCYSEDTKNIQSSSNLLSSSQNLQPFVDTLPSCGDKMDFLSVPPLKYGDFQTITPLGNLNPSGHTFPTDHIYLYLKRVDEKNWDTGTVNVPLYMPGEAWITQITASKHLSDNPPFTDYDLTFYSCKELSFRFGHITSLSDKLLEQLNEENNCDKEYETGGNKYQRCSSDNLNIKISVGQQIGTVGGNQNQNALDIWATDFRSKKLEFSNPNRWYDGVKHNVCPLNYFIEPEKTKLYSLLGGWSNNKRTIEPICGTIEQDIKGTAQGVWFIENTKNTYPEDFHLALVLDNFDPRINVFSVGRSIPYLDSKTYRFTPLSTGEINLAFAQVKPGKVYCYEYRGDGVNNNQDNADSVWGFTILLELLDKETLKIERQLGSECKAPFKFNSGTVFER
ncbi:hypothetical protein HYU21_01395 [Candidatus Woesearchaeota archaeon]|nr:hypothetical protein [Candidatus Woesearchaeota archaeon]